MGYSGPIPSVEESDSAGPSPKKRRTEKLLPVVEPVFVKNDELASETTLATIKMSNVKDMFVRLHMGHKVLGWGRQCNSLPCRCP